MPGYGPDGTPLLRTDSRGTQIRLRPLLSPPQNLSRLFTPVRIAGQWAFSVCRIASSRSFGGRHSPGFCPVSTYCLEGMTVVPVVCNVFADCPPRIHAGCGFWLQGADSAYSGRTYTLAFSATGVAFVPAARPLSSRCSGSALAPKPRPLLSHLLPPPPTCRCCFGFVPAEGGIAVASAAASPSGFPVPFPTKADLPVYRVQMPPQHERWHLQWHPCRKGTLPL